MLKRFRSTGGFTLIEIIVVLAIIAVLAGILAPTLVRYVGDSRTRKAEADVRNIGAAIGMFLADTGLWPIWKSGTNTTYTADKYGVLVTLDGAEPAKADNTGWPTLGGDNPVDDTIDNQLIYNTPGGDTSKAYPPTGRRAWRGPYLELGGIGADPWGSKYMVNVQFLWPGEVDGTKPVFVLSAGPNKLVETNFEQAGPALTVGGDDIVFRVK